MRKFQLTLFIAIACLTGILFDACSSRRSDPLRGPLENTTQQVQNGHALFMMHCQKCHPQGEGGLGPAINSNPAPGFIKRFQIRHGLGVMPSFKADEISKEQLMAISKYMKALRHNKKQSQ